MGCKFLFFIHSLSLGLPPADKTVAQVITPANSAAYNTARDIYNAASIVQAQAAHDASYTACVASNIQVQIVLDADEIASFPGNPVIVARQIADNIARASLASTGYEARLLSLLHCKES